MHDARTRRATRVLASRISVRVYTVLHTREVHACIACGTCMYRVWYMHASRASTLLHARISERFRVQP